MKPWQPFLRQSVRRVRSRSLPLFGALAVLLLTGCSSGPAPGWPGWGGPNGDFTVNSTGLSTAWPTEGPPQVWSRLVGDGYSGILADGERLYTLYRLEDSEVVVALEAATGRTLWEHRYPAVIHKKPDSTDLKYGLGPQSTPLLTGDTVITIGWNGQLHGLDRLSGKVRWSHHLERDFQSTPLSRGFSSSPIAYNDLIICLVGGPGHGLMAFDAGDGRVVWAKHDFKRSHSSPLLINVDGQDQVVGLMDQEVVGVDPDTGALLWSHTHGLAGGLTVSTPAWGEDNLLFISTAYKGGSRALRLTRRDGETSVEELWFNRRMRVHHGNMIRLGDLVYASSGDFGPALLTAIRVSTGEVAWRQRGFAKATLLYADGKLIILDEDGTLALASPTDDGIEILARAQPLEYNCWTVPSLVDTRLYVRNRKRIVAFDLR